MLVVFLQQLINGLVLGSSYALIALGLTMIFGILHVINFAHGEMYMIGAFVTYFLTQIHQVPFLLAIPISMGVVAAIGMIIERVAFRPIIGKPLINGMLLSFGLSIFLANSALLLFTPDPRMIDSGLERLNVTFHGLSITVERLMVIVVFAFLVTVLFFFTQKTKLGTAMRAVAQDRIAAQAVGVNIGHIHRITFVIGSALAAAAGSLIGAIFVVSPAMGWVPVIKSFVVVVLGGFGNAAAVIPAALLLGFIESFGGGYVSYAYKDAYAFGLLLVAFLIRSKGLVGGEK